MTAAASIVPAELVERRNLTVDIPERNLTEEKFRLAVEACPNGMVIIDSQGSMVMANTELEQQFGYLRKELIGRSVDMLLPLRFRAVQTGYREIIDGRPETRRIGIGSDLYGLRKDGSEFSVEIGFTPIHTGKGLLVLGVIVDVSERKDAERHLAQMEGRYRGLLEAAPDAMVVVNPRGEIVLLNLRAERQFGYRRDELLGRLACDGQIHAALAKSDASVESLVATVRDRLKITYPHPWNGTHERSPRPSC